MLNGRAQILKVAPGPTSTASRLYISPTSLAVDVGKLFAAPNVIEPRNPARKLPRVSLPIDVVIKVDRQHIGNVDQLNVSLFARWLIFARNIFSELSFGGVSFMRKAACGDVLAFVEDDPSSASN